ncbi:MAG: 4Fe-4S binding protein [Chromatiaceae bacterium]|nr:4Fe-4S binding protein [Chromatiaceae bacterium]
MWRDLRAVVQSDLVVPHVVAERCVHSHIETASCRACVDACPRDAWVIEAEMLGIDGDKCDGCDLCAPVCPQAAIEGRFSLFRTATGQGGALFVACERAGVERPDQGLMPCLHALGLTDLLQLLRDGVRSLVTSHGDCGSCDRGHAKRLEQRLEEVGCLLASRGLEPLKHRNLGAGAWVETFRQARELAADRTLDRRAFLRNAVKLPRARIAAAIDDPPSAFVPPGTLLEGDAIGALFPFVPAIDPERCNGCDACVRLCPQEAIQLDSQGGGAPAFLIHAEQCSGCGICADVCEQDAVSIACIHPSVERRIPLQAERCSACGTHFHVPAAGPDSERLCWVCRKANHYRNLYQVLD